MSHASTDHRLVCVNLHVATRAAHKTSARAAEQWPIPLPTGEAMSKADASFQVCLSSCSPPKSLEVAATRPMWIHEGTWTKMRRKAALCSTRRPTQARLQECRRLKVEIRQLLKADEELRLDIAATEIKVAMEKDVVVLGHRLLSRWHERREGRGLALSRLSTSKVKEECSQLHQHRPAAPTGEMTPLMAEGLFTVKDTTPSDGEIRAAVCLLK